MRKSLFTGSFFQIQHQAWIEVSDKKLCHDRDLRYQ